MAHIWHAVLDDLQSKVRTDTFDFWFKDITFRRRSNDTIYLGVGDAFIKAWIEENYLDLIEDACTEVAGTSQTVELTIEEETSDSTEATTEAPDETRKIRSVELESERVAGRVSRLPDEETSAFEDPPTEEETPLEAPPRETTSDPRERAREIGLNPAYTFERFGVGDSNQFACAACETVADHPATSYNPLCLYGSVGVGKTHLLQALGRRALEHDPTRSVRYLSGEDFTNRVVSSIQAGNMQAFRTEFRDACDLLLVDDIQTIAGKEATQREFMHTFDALYQNETQIAFTADRHPNRIDQLDDKLASRLGSGLCAELPRPDVETRMAILQCRAEAEALELGDDVAQCLARRLDGNIRDLESMLLRVSAQAELMDREITLEMARDIVEGREPNPDTDLEVADIIECVADHFELSPADLRGARRTRAITKPRQYAMYLAREHTDHSYPDIGERFGGKDHTTVLAAHDKVEDRLETDPELAELIRDLERQLA